jgi:ribosomal protein S18 acetylase RimI-like enzyme
MAVWSGFGAGSALRPAQAILRTTATKETDRVKKAMDAGTVVTYQKEFRAAFEQLNREWIERYFVLEDADREVFGNPEAAVLAPGGQIFFVLDEHNQVQGTCAVLPHGPGNFEIAKMAVAPAARGRGYGDLLMETAVRFAAEAGAQRVTIVSNTVLAPAIRLYEKHGFVRVPLNADGRYRRANIRLERDLGSKAPGALPATNG